MSVSTNPKLIFISAGLLALFALASIVPVSTLHTFTRDIIESTLQAARLKSIEAVLSGIAYDNNILDDRYMGLSADETIDKAARDTSIKAIYRISNQRQPAATVLEATTNRGYNGTIRILVGIDVLGTVTGVRILEHRETPGLGDSIASSHSDWVYSFNGKSLNNPLIDQWSVKKDGGQFDQLTGATISPRAVVSAVKQSLLFYNEHKYKIFPQLAPPLTPASTPEQ